VFSLFFNAPQTELPKIKPLNFDWEGKYLLQKNLTMDSLTYWLTDSLVFQNDTLEMTMTYLKTDSLLQLTPVTDTLNVAMRKARVNPKAKPIKKTATDLKALELKFSNNISSTFEIYNPIKLSFEAPLEEIDISKIKLSQKIDTIFKTIPFEWRQVDSTKMVYTINYKWVAEMNYQLKIDSSAFKSIYKKTSNKLSSDFKIRSLDEYSSVKMFLSEHNPTAYLQILDSKDALLYTKQAQEKGVVFKYLKPGDYYVRMFVDENENGKWDTGDFTTKQQPEEVYYYQKKLTLMANWEFEETWDYTKLPLLQQKPVELMKDGSKKKGGY